MNNDGNKDIRNVKKDVYETDNDDANIKSNYQYESLCKEMENSNIRMCNENKILYQPNIAHEEGFKNSGLNINSSHGVDQFFPQNTHSIDNHLENNTYNFTNNVIDQNYPNFENKKVMEVFMNKEGEANNFFNKNNSNYDGIYGNYNSAPSSIQFMNKKIKFKNNNDNKINHYQLKGETGYENIRNISDNYETVHFDKEKFIGDLHTSGTMKQRSPNHNLENISKATENEPVDETIENGVFNEDCSTAKMDLREEYIKNYNSSYREPRKNDEIYAKTEMDERYIGHNGPLENETYNTGVVQYNAYHQNTIGNVGSNTYGSYGLVEQKNAVNNDYQYKHPGYEQNTSLALKNNEPVYIDPQQYYESDFPGFGFDNVNDQPLYVNVKQYGHIRKRKHRRDYLDSLMQTQENSGYLHESRHKHAMNRMRAASGRFLTKEETAALRKATELENEKNSNDQKPFL